VLELATAFATSFQVDASRFGESFGVVVERADACLLIAETEGVAGYLLGFLHPTFYANGPVGWVEELMVDPRSRRCGVGSRLMGEFEAWVTRDGGQVVALATRRAAAFYSALRYEDSASYFRKVLPRT